MNNIDFGRRRFLKNSLAGCVSVCCLPVWGIDFARKKLKYDLSLDSPARLFDGKNCWAQVRAGIVPGAGHHGMPRTVMTMSLLDLAGDDVYRAMYGMYTDDLGKTWTEIKEQHPLSPRFEIIEREERPVAAGDFWPTWHQASGKLLGTGHTVVYNPQWKVKVPRPRHTCYAVYHPGNNIWSDWQKLEMPDPVKFYNSGAGCSQRLDLPNGNILLPISFDLSGNNYRVTVVKCSFNGQKLSYIAHGNELSVNTATRGLVEPSLACFDGRYYMTIRNDERGFVTKSDDGMHFAPIRPWLFDDGTDLGSYNTQQHWVTHSDGLFLVYTRRGANNDHVFRHRAPLFMAQVDPKTLRVIRNTERILVPERGTRIGNFGVTDVSPDETWVTVSEWMQPKGVEKYGSDGSIFISRIHWNRQNRLFNAKQPKNKHNREKNK